MQRYDHTRESEERNWYTILTVVLTLIVLGLMAYSPAVCPDSDPFQVIRAGLMKFVAMAAALIGIPGAIIVLDRQWEGSIKRRIDEGNIAMAITLSAVVFAIAYVMAWI